jgi:hypothetical protein
LKTKSIVKLYAQTELTLKLTSTSNTKGAWELAPKLKPQVTPLQKSSGVHGIFFETQGYFGNSLIETFPFQSPSKALGFGTISVIMTRTQGKRPRDSKVDEQTREHERRRLNLNYQGFSSRLIRCYWGFYNWICKEYTWYYWWHLHHQSAKRTYQGSHHKPSRKFNSTLVFLCEAIHLKNRPAKNASKLSTINVSTIRWQKES